jgi:hypothetical protein
LWKLESAKEAQAGKDSLRIRAEYAEIPSIPSNPEPKLTMRHQMSSDWTCVTRCGHLNSLSPAIIATKIDDRMSSRKTGIRQAHDGIQKERSHLLTSSGRTSSTLKMIREAMKSAQLPF